MRYNPKELESTLEGLVDTCGLSTVISALSEICHAKAEHLRTNWQDEAMAKIWDHSGKRIAQCAMRVVV